MEVISLKYEIGSIDILYSLNQTVFPILFKKALEQLDIYDKVLREDTLKALKIQKIWYHFDDNLSERGNHVAHCHMEFVRNEDFKVKLPEGHPDM